MARSYRRDLPLALVALAGVLVVALLLFRRSAADPPPRRRVRWHPSVDDGRSHPPPSVANAALPLPPVPVAAWRPYPPTNYERVGFLVGADGDTRPLYGRRSRTRRHRWHYTTTAQDPSAALPLPVTAADGRKCTEDMGCAELYDGNTVSVPGTPTPMRVQTYERHVGW